jgi:hypothetical protein
MSEDLFTPPPPIDFGTPLLDEDKLSSEQEPWDASVLFFFNAYVCREPQEGQNGPIQQKPFKFKHPKDCSISVNTQRTTIDDIQQEVVRIMNEICPDLGNLVMVDTNSKSPQTKWILTLSNSQGGVLNQANKMPLNPSVFKKGTWEIKKSQRGQAKIIVEQKKPTEEDTAKQVCVIQHCSHGSH